MAAVDAANVLVDDELHILSSENNPRWPHNGVSGAGSLFSSPAMQTISQRLAEPERPEDFLAIRVFVLTREGHTGMVRFVYRWDEWMAVWTPTSVQTCVWAPQTTMWMRGY